MITTIGHNELVAIGARHRADYLVEQAGYTLGRAAVDGKPLADLLREGYIEEVTAALAAVSAAQQDHALTAAESKEASEETNKAVQQAKVVRRKISRRAAGARRMGQSVPDALIIVPAVKNVAELLGDLNERIKLLESVKASMPGAATDALLNEAQQARADLQASGATRDIKRHSELPDALQRYYEQKAILYIGLKVINDAGHELHAGDPEAASRYNLGILYRNSGHRKPVTPPQPQA